MFQDQQDIPLPARSAELMPPEALERYGAFMRRETRWPDGDWLKVDLYKARIEPLDVHMRDLLHELTVSVFWPHRAPDIALMFELGTGYLAKDQIDRPVSSAMGIPSGEDFAMLGMMVTTPRLQSQGSGGRLLRRVMGDYAGRDLRLSATKQGYRLYEAAGFIPVGPVSQHQGIARAIRPPEPVTGVSVRPMEAADLAALRALDAHAFGADRSRTLDVLLQRSEVVVAERGGAVEGYAMMRNFGKGRVIGPIVAEQDGVAMQLAAAFIMAHEGSFLRVDSIVESARFEAFLSAAGLGVFDTVTDMRFGRLRRAMSGPQTFGLAMHTLG